MLKHWLIATLLTPICCSAQQDEIIDEKKINFDNFWFNTIQLAEATPSVSTLINISGFQVKDARFDTSTIGFMQKGFPDTRRKLKLNNGTTATIKVFFDTSLHKKNGQGSTPIYEILCVIKKLWLSDEIYSTDGKPSASGENTVHVDVVSGVMLRLDFFASYDNEYIPLYRFDTTIIGKETIFRNGNTYLSTALSGSLNKLAQVSNASISANKKRLSYNEVEQHNTARFDIPILNQFPNKGVYMSFEEFRNNRPSITEYHVSGDVKTDELYAKDKNGKDILLRNIYGFCDGTNIYISGANNFFKLHRTNQTFNMYGAKSLKKSRQFLTAGKIITLGLNPETFSKNNTKIEYKLKYRPYQLDMETGDFY